MGAGTVISPERARSQFEGAADFGALRCWGRSLPKMARLNSRTFMTILWPGFRKHPGRFMFTSCRVRNHPLAWANQACHRLRRCFATPSSLVPANGFATYLYRNTNWPNHLPGSQGRDSVRTARLSRTQQMRVWGGFVRYADRGFPRTLIGRVPIVKTIASSDSSARVGKPFVVFHSCLESLNPSSLRVPSPWCSQHQGNSPQLYW